MTRPDPRRMASALTIMLVHLPATTLARAIGVGVAVLCLSLYARWSLSPAAGARTPALPAAAPLAAEDAGNDHAIRFFEDRVRRDPEDHVALNKLAAAYLQRLRETGNVQYLDLATRAARGSLASVPAEQNLGGLTTLAQAEYAAHNFAAAHDLARRLTELDPRKSLPYAILGDALLELGEYERAAEALRQMAARGGGVETETRLARLASLRGETETAQRHLERALASALDLPQPPPEAVAWCRWQLGETLFASGDYDRAERHYRDALTTFPGYHNALAALGRVRAARGDLAGAIEHYEQAVLRLPDPTIVAALGDLYQLADRRQDAAAQYALVEHIARLGAANGALYNRQLALFYADHDVEAEAAYAHAAEEYRVRRDVYGADAVAWTALKAGRIPEAQGAIQEALRLGTRDARLFYHAGMIARAGGDDVAAREYLQRALALNPRFDPLHAPIAERALEE